MRKAPKYRIYLTNGQRRILAQQLEECRWAYNQTLATRTNAWEQEQRTVDWYETQRALPLLKDVRPSLKVVHSQVLQNVTQRVDLAFQSFFRRVKAGAADVGYPRFKGPGRYDSITYPQYGNGVRLDGDRLILSKVGAVHVGLASFATLSDGAEIANPRFYRRDEADLKRVQKLKDTAKNAQQWDENRRRKKALAHIPRADCQSTRGFISPTNGAANW